MADSKMEMVLSRRVGPGNGLAKWQGRINGPQIWADAWVYVTNGPRGPCQWETYIQEEGRGSIRISCVTGEVCTRAQATDPDYVLRRVLRDIDAAIEAAQEA